MTAPPRRGEGRPRPLERASSYPRQAVQSSRTKAERRVRPCRLDPELRALVDCGWPRPSAACSAGSPGGVRGAPDRPAWSPALAQELALERGDALARSHRTRNDDDASTIATTVSVTKIRATQSGQLRPSTSYPGRRPSAAPLQDKQPRSLAFCTDETGVTLRSMSSDCTTFLSSEWPDQPEPDEHQKDRDGRTPRRARR